ncbi:hypothetical protein BJ322DRAFT_885690 [Thelephora terrestris]|uniref:Uncharacterized protein n=1 Tax=Thelephora terrestris TaxID=56493 RepID=A0A9P6HBZ4_9AGAM|nr:hypothetical protein BJ322DRAFT_885690 [Thelephora terrestris]
MILAWWYVRRRRKRANDEILHEREKQVEDQEARRQAIERSKDPTRQREGDPKPTPYHYGSLLSSGSRIQSSTSTGVTLSQNPFEGTVVGNRATYMAPSSPLFTSVPVMEGSGIDSGWSGAAGIGAGIGGRGGVRDLLNPSASSMSNTSGSVHTVGSAPTLESDSGRSADLDYLRSGGSTDEFIDVDIGGSRVVSPPPHLSMSFGSWNTSSSQDRRSAGSKRSSGIDPGRDPDLGTIDEGQESEGGGHGGLLCPGQHQQHQRDTMDTHTTATLVQMEVLRDEIRGHLRKRSGSPVSWAAPARGTLFIVNQRDSEDL